MSEPFIGELKIFTYANQAQVPKGWAACNGQLLPINQNQALFSLLGTMYGGNGQTTFALPDLRGRLPISFGNSFTQGQAGGEAVHTVLRSEMPQHTHTMMGYSQNGDQPSPTGNVIGAAVGLYGSGAADVSLAATSILNTGGSQPHENMMPYLTLTFGIALIGIFPSRN